MYYLSNSAHFVLIIMFDALRYNINSQHVRKHREHISLLYIIALKREGLGSYIGLHTQPITFTWIWQGWNKIWWHLIDHCPSVQAWGKGMHVTCDPVLPIVSWFFGLTFVLAVWLSNLKKRNHTIQKHLSLIGMHVTQVEKLLVLKYFDTCKKVQTMFW